MQARLSWLPASSWLNGNFDLVCRGVDRSHSRYVAAVEPAMGEGYGRCVFCIAGNCRPLGRTGAPPALVGTLGLLIENGVALPTALKILRNIVVEPRYAAPRSACTKQVRNGRRFADALAETELLPPLAVRMLRVGDEMGNPL